MELGGYEIGLGGKGEIRIEGWGLERILGFGLVVLEFEVGTSWLWFRRL